ncbi:MAG TPA: hypothetical protein VFH27_02175 [Longimicrobiaceae bacterium]|nr:hypothetical protein [Longimicrobiaceae bacterium]
MKPKTAADALPPADLAAVCDTLGLTGSDLASDLGIPLHVVEAWFAGSLAVPRRTAMDLRHRAALAERERLMEDAGLPGCDWVHAWEARVDAEPEKLTLHIAELTAHAETCDRCQARDAFEESLPPLPEPAAPGGIGGLVLRFLDWTGTLPVWARPAVQAGAAFGALTLVRNAVAFLLAMREPRALALGLAATAAATLGAGYLGLVCGFVYRWMIRASSDRPILETGLIGVGGAAALAAACGVPLAAYLRALPTGALAWEVIVLFVAVTGLLFASWLRREQKGVKQPYL